MTLVGLRRSPVAALESEAAVFWKFLDIEASPDDIESAWVLTIELDYRR
jgi:hypothetical protein